MYENYKQKDPLWSEDKIKGTNLLMKRWGCVITSLANLAVYYGYTTNPGRLNQRLKFTPEGLVYWSSFTELYPEIPLVKIYDWSKVSTNLEKVDELLITNGPLIVQTMIGFFRNKSHFVTIWEKKNGRYVMSDPLSNGMDFQIKYGDPSRWILKVISYRGKKVDPNEEKLKNIKSLISVVDLKIQEVKNILDN